jgi:hypothetical protein
VLREHLDIDPFVLAVTDLQAYAAQYRGCDRMQADLNGDGVVNSFDINYLTGAMGNVATKFEWDAENRLALDAAGTADWCEPLGGFPASAERPCQGLVRVAPLRSPQAGDVETRFPYDYQGRRIEKIVSEYRTTPSAGWYETDHRKFVWSGPALDTVGSSADRSAVPGLRPTAASRVPSC